MISWIYAFIDRDANKWQTAADFWTTVTGTSLSPRRGTSGEFATLLPQQGDPYLKLQGVTDPQGDHLDLCVDDAPRTIGLAQRLGATIVNQRERSATLTSPSGLRFCVGPGQGEQTPPPDHVSSTGATSRVYQISLDIAPSAFDTEVAFWRALTGMSYQPGKMPQFGWLVPAAELPVRILVQRIEEERPTTAHLDLGGSDQESMREWHVSCGATVLSKHPHWYIMRDPAGGTYCLVQR